MQCLPRKNKKATLAVLLLALLFLARQASTQYSGGPSPALTGSTLGENLRNSAVATQNQVTLLRTAADNWVRRAGSVNYTDVLLRQDLGNVQWQFQGLRTQFNYLGQLALQLGRPSANNAVAELDAGLNIIAEIFVFLTEQYAGGNLDRATVVRTGRLFEEAIREWEQEFKRNSSRLGVVR